MTDKITMPFTGETPENLNKVLTLISTHELSIELFDVFLAEYKKHGELFTAVWNAQSEWDC